MKEKATYENSIKIGSQEGKVIVELYYDQSEHQYQDGAKYYSYSHKITSFLGTKMLSENIIDGSWKQAFALAKDMVDSTIAYLKSNDSNSTIDSEAKRLGFTKQ